MNSGFSAAAFKSLIEYALKGERKNYHVTRLAMYKALRLAFAEHDGPDRRCLSISSSGHLAQVLGLQSVQITEANYPQHNMAALTSIPDDTFDFCISDMVLEHVEGDPFVAFSESVRVLKSGGRLCHTTCFAYPTHGYPKDFWRFTPIALELMARGAGCCEMQAAGWGNLDAWALFHAGFGMARIPDDPQNPIYQIATNNDPAWPIVTWIIATKP
ncbi:MAG: methyltransferase domain-containing protein [Acetobacteraceae bacterium]